MNLNPNDVWYFAPSVEIQSPDLNGFMKICTTFSPGNILLNLPDGTSITVSIQTNLQIFISNM